MQTNVNWSKISCSFYNTLKPKNHKLYFVPSQTHIFARAISAFLSKKQKLTFFCSVSAIFFPTIFFVNIISVNQKSIFVFFCMILFLPYLINYYIILFYTYFFILKLLCLTFDCQSDILTFSMI